MATVAEGADQSTELFTRLLEKKTQASANVPMAHGLPRNGTGSLPGGTHLEATQTCAASAHLPEPLPEPRSPGWFPPAGEAYHLAQVPR